MDNALTVRQVAEVLGVDKQTVYRLVWAAALPWMNIGTGQGRARIRIRRSAVEAFMASREKGAAA